MALLDFQVAKVAHNRNISVEESRKSAAAD
jgi:hypothetical protein